MKRILFYCTTLLFSTSVFADVHQDLLRSSLVLNGSRSTLEQHQRLRAAIDKEAELKTIQKEMVASRDFAELMVHRMRDHFMIRETVTADFDKLGLKNIYDSFNLTVMDVVQNNRSWDEMFMGSLGQINKQSEANIFSNFLDGLFASIFFSDSVSSKKEDVIQLRDYVQSIDKRKSLEENLSGVVTTGSFFQRYPTTKVNKNRKRAAALFRTLLCDDMKPVILPSKNEDMELLGQALNLNQDQTSNHPNAQETKHGSDPSCQACHFKLDPAGQVFRTSSSKINTKQSPGALVLKNSKGEIERVEVKNIKELLTAMTKRPEYATCQVKTFWKWMVGSDVPLSEERLKLLVNEFEASGRRPKEFVLKVISSPEFTNPPRVQSVNAINFSHVQPILRRCDSCHTMEGWIPSFSRFPFGSSLDENLTWTKKIARMLDLNGDGSQAKMPPAESSWHLNSQEREVLRAWIQGDAKDLKGQKTLPENEGKILVEGEINNDFILPKTQFGFTYQRYLNGFELVNTLKNQFHLNNSMYGASDLSNLEKQSAYGISFPGLGEPLFKSPTPSTFNAYIRLIGYPEGNALCQRLAKDDLLGSQEFPCQQAGLLSEAKRAKVFAALVDLMRPELIEDPNERLRVYNHLAREMARLHIYSESDLIAPALKLMISKDYLTVGTQTGALK